MHPTVHRAGLMLVVLVAAATVATAQSTKKILPVYHGANSDYIATYQEVLRDSAAFAAAWELSGALAAKGKAPKINFKKRMIIIAAGKGTASDSLVLQWSPSQKGVVTVVTYRNCVPGAAPTMPVEILAVPADPGSVLFREKQVRADRCPVSKPAPASRTP